MAFNPNSFGSQPDNETVNQLLKYLKNQSPDVLSRVAKSASPEIQQIISQNVLSMVGMLPSENFSVQICTNRENLAGLLASAMMTGYFLRQMEQRMELEKTYCDSVPWRQKPPQDEKPNDSSGAPN